MLLKGMSGGRMRETLIFKSLTAPNEVVLPLPRAKLISEACIVPHFSRLHVR